jgi:hypothetical protein
MVPYPEWPLEESRAGTGLRWWGGHGRAQPVPDEASERCEPKLQAPPRWGLSAAAVAHLGDCLFQVWRRFRGCFTTRTRGTRARLRLSACPVDHGHRTERRQDGPYLAWGDGPALPHVMSNSPWSGPAVFDQRQAEIKVTPAVAHGSTLILDESADEQAGTHNAGASRQYNGRLGKVDVCRVDPCLPSANGGWWAMVDGALFLPEAWFGAAFAPRRSELGIPPERRFETKIALGLKMGKRVKATGSHSTSWPVMRCMGGTARCAPTWRQKTSSMRRKCLRTHWCI